VDGFVAIEVDVDEHPPLEVAMVGREGMVGMNLVLGVPSTAAQSVVQGAGAAWRIGARALRTEMSRSPALKRGLDLYVSVVLAQFATAVACRRFHEIAPRLARWLLMSRDRTSAEDVQVTHEVLATLLGVRRVGITMAAGELQRLGLIAYHRGHVTVLDRTGLAAMSCSCYATDLGAYALRLG
jgi:CRP-like cAMP-binding protein